MSHGNLINNEMMMLKTADFAPEKCTLSQCQCQSQFAGIIKWHCAYSTAKLTTVSVATILTSIVRVVWSQAIVNTGGGRGTVSRGVNTILIHTAVLQRGRWDRGDLFHKYLFLYDSQAKQQVCSVSGSDMSCPVCVRFKHMFHHPLLLSQACALRESGWAQEQQAVIGWGCYVR